MVIFHVGSGSLEHRERGVTFVKMANLGVDSQGAQQPPASNTKDQLLFHAQLRTSAVKLRRDAAVGRGVRWIVGIEQIQLRPADLHLPRPNPQLKARQREDYA